MIRKWPWYKRDNPLRGVHVSKNSPRVFFLMHAHLIVDYSLHSKLLIGWYV